MKPWMVVILSLPVLSFAETRVRTESRPPPDAAKPAPAIKIPGPGMTTPLSLPPASAPPTATAKPEPVPVTPIPVSPPSAPVAPDYSGRALTSPDGVLKLGGTSEQPLLKLYDKEQNYFYAQLVESHTAVAAPRFLVSSSPGAYWVGEIWAEDYNTYFGMQPTPEHPQAVLLQSAWDGKNFEAKELRVHAVDAKGESRDWAFLNSGRLDAGSNALVNVAALAFADGTTLTTAGGGGSPAGLTTNQVIGEGPGAMVFHIQNGIIVAITPAEDAQPAASEPAAVERR